MKTNLKTIELLDEMIKEQDLLIDDIYKTCSKWQNDTSPNGKEMYHYNLGRLGSVQAFKNDLIILTKNIVSLYHEQVSKDMEEVADLIQSVRGKETIKYGIVYNICIEYDSDYKGQPYGPYIYEVMCKQDLIDYVKKLNNKEQPCRDDTDTITYFYYDDLFDSYDDALYFIKNFSR
jgi:hypothetical protein